EGKSASSMITVVQVPVSTVLVTPALSTLAAGKTLELSVTLRDDLNNVLIGRTVNWTSSDPTIASISGAGGVVTGLKPGTVTLTATSEGKSGTAQVAVILGAPARLHFVQQPSSTQAGSVITPEVAVEIQDAAGNRILPATSTVTVALATPGGALLGGTRSVNAVDGLARFGDLTVDVAGSYSLTAASAGLASATSASFAVTVRPATRLAFQQQPLSTTAGTSLGTVTVELQDATGARVTGQVAVVTLALGSNPGGATLSGTLTRTSVNGLATFTGLSLDRAGTGYTLTATASGLGGATSSAFTIAAGPPSQLKFVVQPCPAPCPVGALLAPPPQVAVQDALGNTVTGSTATISLTLKGGGKETVLSGTSSRAAVAGNAAFPDLTINRAAVGLTLRAASRGLSDGTSAAFGIAGP
ncbi:MAG TPA: Ig-like domain-containing protein, partial [Gemmatimonadales bacterium]|nr:Ig-like domain-containing protein [Gemmatimonadales bacterium]